MYIFFSMKKIYHEVVVLVRCIYNTLALYILFQPIKYMLIIVSPDIGIRVEDLVL